MNPALSDRVLALADDSLILAHRNSEWAGHAPILEEDIAFANLALDEMGHARLWYDLYQQLTGEEPDRVVYFRPASEWRNTQFVELPKGDWAFSMLRQYLYDVYESILLPELITSRDSRVAEIAGKMRAEEIYHVRHTSNWVKRLGLGTDESHSRMQRALDELWSYALQLFVPLPGESTLIDEGIVPSPMALSQAWEQAARDHLANAGLYVPHSLSPAATSRTEHTEHLTQLLEDLQQVARTEPFGVEW